MLIDATTRPDGLQEAGLKRWESERWTVLWKGFVFSPGRGAGVPSIEHLADQLATRELRHLAQTLRGVFGLFVHDRQNRTWQIAVDNAGLYRIHYDDRFAATSFLELITATARSADDLEPAAVASYLTCGYVFGADTLIAGIRKLRADQVLELGDGAPAPRIVQKSLRPPSADATATVSAYFADLATAVHGRRLSVDATGGFDTRLILCMLHHHGVDFEMAVSSARESSDKRIAEQIARMLQRPFVVTGHDIEHLEQDLVATFHDADAQTDLRHFHRNRQNVLGRRERGVEVMAHGGGGEVFRDYFFVHDFPFYGSASANFPRYYDLRFATVRIALQHVGRDYRPLVAASRAEAVRRFELFRSPTNNMSFNRVAYFLRAPEFFGPFFSGYINLGVEVVAPFLDYDNAMAGMNLPPWQGFYNRWHRAMITRHNPALAALPTSEGYTASSAARHLPGDLWAYGIAQASRVGKKLGQRALGRTLFHRVGALASDSPGYNDRLRQTSHFATAIERLKSAGILAADLDPDDLREAHLGRILTLGMLLGHVDGEHATGAPEPAPALSSPAGPPPAPARRAAG